MPRGSDPLFWGPVGVQTPPRHPPRLPEGPGLYPTTAQGGPGQVRRRAPAMAGGQGQGWPSPPAQPPHGGRRVRPKQTAPTCLSMKRPARWDPLYRGRGVRKGQEETGEDKAPRGLGPPSGEEGSSGCPSIAVTWLVPKASPPQPPPSQPHPQGPKHHGHTAGGAGESAWDHGEARTRHRGPDIQSAHTRATHWESRPPALLTLRTSLSQPWPSAADTGHPWCPGQASGAEKEARGGAGGWRWRREDWLLQ